MTLTNFSGDTNQKTLQELYCSEELTGGIHNQLILLSGLNIFLSITAFLGNTLILLALHKESSLHPPSKLLFRSLAITDLCVGIIVEPLAVTYWLSSVNERWNICRYSNVTHHITGYTLCATSLMTLVAISGDRLLALLMGPRYKQVVTLKRTFVAVIFVWVISISCSTMSFWNYLISQWVGYIGISMCMVISIYSYKKIFLTLRYHQNQVQDNLQGQRSQTSHLNIARYKKAVYSALWLQVTLVACYLPYNVVGALTFQDRLSSRDYLMREFAATLIYLNSSINPILYCWRIREVKQAVKDTIRQLYCSPD